MNEPNVVLGIVIGREYPLALIEGEVIKAEVTSVHVADMGLLAMWEVKTDDAGDPLPDWHPDYEEPEAKEIDSISVTVHLQITETTHRAMEDLHFELRSEKFHELVLEAETTPPTEPVTE